MEPLKITCTSSRCEDGLHCYRQKQERGTVGSLSGPCRSCGADLVSWDRVHARNMADVDHTFAALETELIRHEYWHREIDEVAVTHARRKGTVKLRDAVDRRIRKALAPEHLWRDGAQTPLEGNIIYYAQHATATCCRKCAEEWHGIERGRQMSEEEIVYCSEIVWRYIQKRLPMLTEAGEHIPRKQLKAQEATTKPLTAAQKLRQAMRAKQEGGRRADN